MAGSDQHLCDSSVSLAIHTQVQTQLFSPYKAFSLYKHMEKQEVGTGTRSISHINLGFGDANDKRSSNFNFCLEENQMISSSISQIIPHKGKVRCQPLTLA